VYQTDEEMLGMHGEYKTPGGKLVMVDFDVTDGKLANVMVSGDFFLYPEETLESINNALEHAPVATQTDELVRILDQAIPSDAELFGFSTSAIVTALQRGLS
jgi:lipoate---protein ligase